MKAVARTPMRITKTPRFYTHSNQNHSENNSNNARDPVQVFCRIRPLPSDADLSCLRVKNTSTVIITPPEQTLQYRATASHRETQYIFKHVFEANASQRHVFGFVAQPLVENLIRGKNSLLFTYGVTGSGKTYTMTGNGTNRGIMPRCLDVLFRTISDYQTKKFVFKPDRLNGFEILSEADALLERQAEMNQRFMSGNGRGGFHRLRESDPEIASQASCEVAPLPGLDEDNMFAVFISYVEVYNNSVYDLLEDTNIQNKPLQSKIIREDVNHNMFVHGVTEVEIKSVEEAIEAFQLGQKRKRMGHTVLNAESSRSHCVFNVRLVQAPTDSQGENVLQDKRTITISQLSLVDLAGSERSSRTKNTGLRLREAGNINNSLMTLRTCLEYLRENQQSLAANANSGGSTAPKKIPYRDSKITHMFKNYFDGEGQVSMIVCVNPRAEDYDENTQVMKFAEMTQEVQVARAAPMKPDLGLTPGRRKANKLFKIAVNNLNELGHTEAKKLDVDIGLVYTLGPNFPHYEIGSVEAETTIKDLMSCLQHRIEKRAILSADLEKRFENFRAYILEMEKNNLMLRTELDSLKAAYNHERERCMSFENKVMLHESSIDVLNNKLSNRERQIDELTRKLNKQQQLITQKDQEKEKQKKKFTSKLAVEVDKKERELEVRLRQQREKMQEKMRVKDEKLKLVSNILKSDEIPKLVRSQSSENVLDDEPKRRPLQHQQPKPPQQQPVVSDYTQPSTIRTDVYCTPARARGMAAANSRHRRSRSAGERWIEHRAANPVPLGTILQPYLRNRKSITKLKDMKDLTSYKPTKYCLVSQEADTDGDVETKLFKGNVIPTCGGGAQVIFNDVECLKQKSPVTSPNRKRPSTGNANNSVAMNGVCSALGSASASAMPSIEAAQTTTTSRTTTRDQDLTSRCNIGIEGHSTFKRTRL